MAKARTVYFHAHKASAARAAFVAAQKARLAALRAAASAACTVAGPLDGGPVAAPPPSANEHFVFSDEMSQADRAELQGYITFAAHDEETMLGVPLADLTTFASTNAGWLAQQECSFLAQSGDCVSRAEQNYLSGNTGGAGRGAVFVYWKSEDFHSPSPPFIRQKIVANTVFGAFEHQLDGRLDDPGPYWLNFGAAELIGYHVAADRKLAAWADLLSQLKASLRLMGWLPSQVMSPDQYVYVGHYWLAGVADHLVTIAPAGLRSLTDFWTALGTGATWPDAFNSAFGLTPAAFDVNFDTYRKGL